jgi:hypothetical protein
MAEVALTIVAGRYDNAAHDRAWIKYSGLDGEHLIERDRDHKLWHEMLSSCVIKDFDGGIFSPFQSTPAPLPPVNVTPLPQPSTAMDLARLAQIEARLNRIETRLTQVEQRASAGSSITAQDMERLAQRVITSLEARIAALEQNHARVNGFDQRLAELERVLLNIESAVKGVLAA